VACALAAAPDGSVLLGSLCRAHEDTPDSSIEGKVTAGATS
jgi:hypothetical protein